VHFAAFICVWPLSCAWLADSRPALAACGHGLGGRRLGAGGGGTQACLGLSFTIGPVSGGYLARAAGPRAVFGVSLLLALADLAYVALVLPESNSPSVALAPARRVANSLRSWTAGRGGGGGGVGGSSGGGSSSGGEEEEPLIPAAYSPLDALGVFSGDPLLSQVARVTFLYYTGVRALLLHFTRIHRARRPSPAG